MPSLAVLGLASFTLVVAISLAVPLLVEIQERRRRARLPPRRAPGFRPVIIQGGRSDPVAADIAAPVEMPESRIA